MTNIQPLYFVTHPDGSYSVADPQPELVTAETGEGTYVEADGCPTELAVLQRFWRANQNKYKSIDAALASTLDYRNDPKYDGPLTGGSV